MKSRWVLMLVLALGPAAHAETNESLEYRYYSVTVPPGAELRESINRVSPIREAGKVFHGYTHWDVQWRFWWNADLSGACTMREVRTTLKGTITLPRLESANDEQTKRFRRYIVALDGHEHGHYDLARQAAREIDQTLARLPRMSSCAELERTANQTGHAILDRYNKENKDYDARTEHGRTQGAWLER